MDLRLEGHPRGHVRRAVEPKLAEEDILVLVATHSGLPLNEN